MRALDPQTEEKGQQATSALSWQASTADCRESAQKFRPKSLEFFVSFKVGNRPAGLALNHRRKSGEAQLIVLFAFNCVCLSNVGGRPPSAEGEALHVSWAD